MCYSVFVFKHRSARLRQIERPKLGTEWPEALIATTSSMLLVCSILIDSIGQ
jgi:hypothetical protein